MKVKVIKKIMAYLLVGAMVISTPITASAAETSIADVYTSTDDADKSSGTATLSSTETGSYKFEDVLRDPDREAQVIGLALDKSSLSLEVNGGLQTDRLQARVLYSGYDPKDEQMVLAADQKTKEIIDNYLRWEVIGNENRVVGISYYENPVDGSQDHSMINVKAKNGGNVTVRAFIDYNADGSLNDGEYYADATVSVKQLADSIKFSNLPDKFYLKQKYDLNKYITVEPATATTCNVSFYVDTADAKKVTISDDGVLTVKKVKDPETIKLYATTENGKQADASITLHPGVPANTVKITSSKGDNKGVTLDFGKLRNDNMTTAVLDVDLQPKNGVTEKVTDSVEWSVKNPKTPVIEMTEIPSADDTRILHVQVKALSVGTATVTAKASSGKKGTYKITVDSTPYGVAITDIETWTGKKPALTAVLLADDGITSIPVGKTKVTYAAPKKQADDPRSTNIKNIKVNGKGVITSSNLLTDTKKGSIPKDSRTINVTVKHAKDPAITGSCVVTVKQANIKNITVTDVTHGAPGTPIVFDNKKKDGTAKPLNAVSGGKYKYQALAFSDDNCTMPALDDENCSLDDAIAWASSSAKVGTITENGQFTVLQGGTTKLTASYVTVTNGKAKLNKKTITIKAVQKAESLTLNKNVFVVAAGTNKAKVTINVKKQLPKGSKDTITWKRIDGDENGNMLTPAGENVTSADMGENQNIGTGNKITVNIPTNVPAGRVIKIGAYADGGAVAYAYIYVVDSKTKAVRATKGGDAIPKNKIPLTVGDTYTITPQVQASVKGASFVDTTEYVRENIGYTKDPVKYSFNKAGIASIDRNGVITALKPGTTKLTIQTLSGKKSTVTITVTQESNS